MTAPAASSPETWLFVQSWALHHPGGVNQVVLGLARAMRIEGVIRPLVGINGWGQRHAASEAFENLEVLRLWAPSPWTEDGALRNACRYVLSLPFTLLRLSRLLRRYHVRVINVHYPDVAALNWILLRRTGLFRGRVILSVHGMDVHASLRASRMVRILWRYMLKHCDAVVACSDRLRRELEQGYHLEGANTVTVYNGVDIDSLDSIRRAKGAAGALPALCSPYLVNVGTFEHKKGQDVLIEAFGLVADSYPDLQLVIMGRHGAVSESIAQHITSLPIGNRIHLLENVAHADVLNTIAGSTAVIVASRYEPFGIAALEAIALGRPLIVTNICGIVEKMENGRTAFIVPPDDPQRLADRIRFLLDNPQQAAIVARDAHSELLPALSWSDSWLEYARIAELRNVRIS